MSGLVAGVIGAAGAGVGLYQALTKKPVTCLQILSQSGDVILIFDAVVSESLTWSSDVTDKPVEDGSNVNDHNIRKPFTTSFVGIVSDTPLNTQATLAAEAATTALSAVTPPLGIVAAAAAYAAYNSSSTAPTPSKIALQQLLTLKNGDTTKSPPTPPPLFSIINPQGQWDNLQMTELNIQKSLDTDGTLVFSCTVKQVVIVSAQSVNVSVLSNPGLSAGKTKGGEQGTEDLSDIKQAGIQGRFEGIKGQDALTADEGGNLVGR